MDTQGEYCDEKLIVPPNSLDELIAELRNIFAHDRVNIEYVKALLASYKSNPKDWKKFAKFDRHRYTRNLVDEGNGKYNLMCLCWGEGHGSSIHDHANADCFVKVLDGQLRETRFAWPQDSQLEQPLVKTGQDVYPQDAVTYMCDELGLHRMENPSHVDSAVTLHLYCPPFSDCQMFDQSTGHTTTARMTFWSKYGQRTPFKSSTTDVPTIDSEASREPENN